MTRPQIDSAARRGVSHKRSGRKTAGGLAMALAMILLTPSGAALAVCTTSGTTTTCSSNTSGNGSQSAIIGTGRTTPDGSTVNVNANVSVTNGGQTVISQGDKSSINIGAGATVYGQANTNGGGNYNSGPNVIEANSGNTITIAAGATVTQNGTTTNGEAINVHGNSNTIINNGTIHSTNGAALWFQDTNNDGTSTRNTVVNNVGGVISTAKGDGYNVFGSSSGVNAPGLDFENYGTVKGSLRFGNGNDSLLFGTGSVITGNVDGGGGTNDLTLDATLATDSATLGGSVANFSTIEKTGQGGWAILGEVPSEGGGGDPSSPPSPITGALNNIKTVTVTDGSLLIVGAAPDFTGDVVINSDTAKGTAGTLIVQAESINNANSVTNNSILVFDQPNDDEYTGKGITGSGMVIKEADGVLTMDSSTVNTYTGGTWIKEGTVVVNKDSDLGGAGGQLALGTARLDGNTQGTLQINTSFNNGRNVILDDGGGVINTNGSGVSATFSGGLAGTGNLTKAGDGTLTLSNNSNIYTGNTIVSGGTLAIASDGALGNGGRLVLQDTTTLQLNNTLTSNRAVTLTPGAAAINTNGNNGTFNGVIDGGGKLIKDGDGILTLTASNNYQGGTQIKKGTVAINSDNALGTNNSTQLEMQSGTTLQLDNSVTMGSRPINLSGTDATINTKGNTGTFGGVVSGSGKLIIDDSTAGGPGNSTSVVKLYGANTYAGGTQVKQGTVAIRDDSSLGAAGGGLELQDRTTLQLDGTVTSNSRGIELSGTQATINTQNNTGTFSGVVSGTGQLVKTGGGTLALYGDNTYGGGTQIQSGTLAIKGASALGSGTDTELWNQTTMRLDGDTTISNQNLIVGNTAVNSTTPNKVTINTNGYNGTINSVISEAANVPAGGTQLVKSGAGILTLYGQNTYKGGTLINQGTVAIKDDSGLGAASGKLTMNNNTTLQLDAGVTSGREVSLTSGSATINTKGNTGTFNGTVGGGGKLVVDDSTGGSAGVVELYGNNTYSGGTQVKKGTVAIKSDTGLGTSGSQLELEDNTTLRLDADVTSANRPINLSGTTATINTQANNGTFSGVVSGNGQLIKDGGGILALYGNNSYRGGTVVNAGTVAIKSDTGLGASGSGLELKTGTTLQLEANVTSANRPINLSGTTATINTKGNTGTFSGVVSGGGQLIVDDSTGGNAGVVALYGNNTYGGGTQINKGTVAIKSDTGLGAAGGVLTMSDDTTLRLDGTVVSSRNITLAGTSAGNKTIDTNGNNGTFSGDISGDGDLVKKGAGVLALYGANNTYTGGTQIQKGTLAIKGEHALGNNTNELELWNQTTLRLDAAATIENRDILIGDTTETSGPPNQVTIDTQTFDGKITFVIKEAAGAPATGLIKDGTGTLALYGDNTYKGGTTINKGTVAIEADSGLGAAGTALTMNDQTTLRLDAGNIIIDTRPVNLVGGTATVNTQGYTGTINGLVSGSGGLNKTGSGVLQLYGNNTYSGGTRVSAGTLAINGNNSLGSAGSRLTMDNGTTLRLDAATVDVGQRPMTINGSSVTINARDNTGTFGGVIDGTAKLIIDDSTDSGKSVVKLYGSNTYSGGTEVRSGTVAIKGPSAFGSGSEVELWNQTTLQLDAAATISNQNLIIGNTGKDSTRPTEVTINTNGFDGTINSAITEAAAGTELIKTGGGVLALYGNSTYSGGTKLNQGTIAIKADSGLGATNARLTMADGTILRLDDNVTSASRPITLTGGQATINTQNNTGTFSGLVNGAGQLVKTGGGVLALYNESNSYTGGTVVAAGTLAIKSAGALGTNDAKALELKNQTTLRLDANVDMGASKVVNLSGASATVDTQGNAGIVRGTVTGTGQLIKRGNGSLELTNTGNDYAGGTWIQQGRVIISDNDALGAAGGELKMDGQTTLQTNADVESSRKVNLSGGQATLDTRGYTDKFSGVVSGTGGLIIDDQSGAATSTSRVELTGNNSYSGGTTVKKGTLAINNDKALGSEAGALTLFDKTTLELMASITNNTRPINLDSGTATINTLGNTGTFGGNIGGAGGLDKTGSGTLALLGNSTYAGNTRVKQGTLAINSGSSLGQGTRLELWNKTTLELRGNTLFESSRQLVIGDNSAPDAATPGNAAIPNSVTINTGVYSGQIDGNITQAADNLIDPTGGVRLDKTGTGVLALYGENQHKGGTWVKQGTLAIKSEAALSTGGLYLGYHGNTAHHGGEAGLPVDSAGTLRFDGDLGGSGFYTNVFLNSGGGVIDTQGYAILFNGNTIQDGNDDPLFASPPYTRAQGSYQVGDGAGT